MDDDQGRQAQLLWMLGVGFLLLLAGYYHSLVPVQARGLRTPAQLTQAPPAPSALPDSTARTN